MAEPENEPSARRKVLTRTVVVLGMVSLWTDLATEMAMPFIPYFVTTTLGASAAMLGVIEGTADATSSVLKLLSGRWADKLGRHRPFVLAGYVLASVVRPFVAVATQAWHIVAIRATDRVGKGLRTSPRDAMIAASVDESHRGTAFGFHRAMDHTGAVLGPLVALAILQWWTDDLRVLFWLTAIPGALAVLTLFFGLRSVTPDSTAEDEVEPPVDLPEKLPAGYRRDLARILVPMGIFSLGNASDLFLLLRAGGERASLTTLPLLWVALHVVKALASIPGGALSDKMGARRTIIIGWIFYAAIYLGFGIAQEQRTLWILFVAYGFYYGLTEGAEKSLISKVAPPNVRGTAFGWYHMTVGLAAFPASVGFGALWTLIGPTAAFSVSASLALVGAISLWWLAPHRSS